MPEARSGDATVKGVRLQAMTDSLGFLLRLSQLQNFAAFHAALGGMGIRPGEVSVLIVLRDNPGIRQGELARALMIKRAHMTKLVASMLASGLITRAVPEEDKRSVQLSLSPQGQTALERMQGPLRAFEESSSGRLTEAEDRALKGLLLKYLGLDPDSPVWTRDNAGKDAR